MNIEVTSPAKFQSDIAVAFWRMETEEPQEIFRLRTGTMLNQVGSYGQYFGTWDVAHGMLRDFAFYSLYPLLRISRSQPGANLPILLDEMFEPYTNYLGFSGFPELEEFGVRLRAIASKCSVKDTTACLSSYVMYANRLYAWAYHYFPWQLGEQFRYSLEPEHLNPASSVASKAQEAVGRSIVLTWRPLDISVTAILADNLNRELCDDVIAAAPFVVLQQHPIVSGKSMFAWGAPIASTAPIYVREEIRLAPVGRLRFSQRTGQKLIIQYGPTTETIFAPVLGSVVPEDLHKLADVGRAVWESTYMTKMPIYLHVQKR